MNPMRFYRNSGWKRGIVDVSAQGDIKGVNGVKIKKIKIGVDINRFVR